MRIPDRDNSEDEGETICEEIMSMSFPEWMYYTNS